MHTRQQPLPPAYWLSILLDAIRDGDFSAAGRADRQLRELGVEVSLRRMIPDFAPQPSEAEVSR